MKIAVLLEAAVDFARLEVKSGPILEWFDSYVIDALRALKHEVILLHNHDDVRVTIDELRAARPALVFNLAGCARGREEWAGHIAAMLDLLGIPYTGAGPDGIMLAIDKALSKQVLRDSGVAVPGFVVAPRGAPVPPTPLRYPVLVKALSSGGSHGLTKSSVVHDRRALESRVAVMHRKLHLDAICEEFIDGPEVSVTLLGDPRRPAILPICEWLFTGDVSFLTERAKWDQAYRKTSGVGYRPAQLAKDTFDEVCRAAKIAYETLRMRDYGRVDFRIARDGAVHFLDGNANFGLRPVSPEMNSLPFEEVIRRIVESARARGRPS